MTVRLHVSEACRVVRTRGEGAPCETRRVEWWQAEGPGASPHTAIKSLNTSPRGRFKHHFCC